MAVACCLDYEVDLLMNLSASWESGAVSLLHLMACSFWVLLSGFALLLLGVFEYFSFPLCNCSVLTSHEPKELNSIRIYESVLISPLSPPNLLPS